jgi:hypothetical protein
VLGDIGVRPRGVRTPITWQSVALGDAASVEPVTPKLYQRWIGTRFESPSLPVSEHLT